MASEWSINRGGEKIGPVSSQQLKAMAASGELREDDQVWKEGMDDWTSAFRLKGLVFPSANGQSQPPPVDAPAAQDDPLAALGQAAHQKPVAAVRPAYGPKKKSPVGLIVGAAAVVVLLAAGLAANAGSDDPTFFGAGGTSTTQQADPAPASPAPHSAAPSSQEHRPRRPADQPKPQPPKPKSLLTFENKSVYDAFPELSKVLTSGKADERADLASQILDYVSKSNPNPTLRTAFYDVAKKLFTLAGKSAEATRVQKLQEEFAKAKDAYQVITTQPDNKEAMASVGQFECLYNNNWGLGIKLLADGNPSNEQTDHMHKLAGIERDATKSEEAKLTDPFAVVTIADGWEAFAKSQQGVAKESVHQHALSLYQDALPGLVLAQSGDKAAEAKKEKARVDKILAAAANSSPVAAVASALIGKWQVAIDKTGYKGVWVFDKDGNVSSPHGPGTWKIVGQAVKITWGTPDKWETFNLPLNPQGTTGASWFKGAVVSAKKVN